MNRRRFLKTTATAGAGTLVFSGAAISAGCGKNITTYTATVIGTLEELLPLLPHLSDPLKKAISTAKTFDEAYRGGKFADAATLFTNLSTLAAQIFAQSAGSSPAVNVALAVGGVALRAIATLLKSQSADPQVVAAVAASSNSAVKGMIERMADPAVINQVVNVVKP